jgi:hypothetical protein
MLGAVSMATKQELACGALPTFEGETTMKLAAASAFAMMLEILMFQKDNEMRNIVLTDAEARDKATRHFFNRASERLAAGRYLTANSLVGQ